MSPTIKKATNGVSAIQGLADKQPRKTQQPSRQLPSRRTAGTSNRSEAPEHVRLSDKGKTRTQPSDKRVSKEPEAAPLVEELPELSDDQTFPQSPQLSPELTLPPLPPTPSHPVSRPYSFLTPQQSPSSLQQAPFRSSPGRILIDIVIQKIAEFRAEQEEQRGGSRVSTSPTTPRPLAQQLAFNTTPQDDDERQTNASADFHSAPHFDGAPRRVRQFLSQYGALADEAKLSQFDKVRSVTAYMDDRAAEMVEQYDEWADLEEAGCPADAWDSFKKRLLGDYPDAAAPKIYGREEYEQFIEDARSKPPQNTADLHEFNREWTAHTAKLKKSGDVSVKELLTAYGRILYQVLGEQFAVELRIHETSQSPTKSLDIDDFKTVAQKMYEARAKKTDLSSIFSMVVDAKPKPRAQLQHKVKFEEESTSALQNRIRVLEQELASRDRATAPTNRGPPPPDKRGQPKLSAKPNTTSQQWLLLLCANKVMRNSAGHVVLTDGGRIPREYPTEPFNLTVGGESQDDNEGSAAGDWFGHMYDQAVLGLRSQTRPNGPNEQGRAPQQAGSANRAGAKDTPPHLNGRSVDRVDPPAAIRGQAPAQPPAVETVPAPPLVYGTPRAPAYGGQPQFKIRAPVSDSNLARAVANKVLKTTMEIEVGHLLGLSPEVMRFIRGDITPRRAEVVANSALVEEEVDIYRYEIQKPGHSIERRAADTKMNLRYVDATIGVAVAEGLLDSGSQVCVMSERLWAALGSPAVLTHQLTLVSANGSRAQTIGLCEHLEMVVGGVPLYMQFHIVQEAPFDLLLGRPFFSLTRAVEENKMDGASYLTLHDPNSPTKICMATKERVPEGELPLVRSRPDNPHNNADYVSTNVLIEDF
ncbi:hypothetical protein BKA62DRAFT_776104 [Auriculariales sp. MPI-PUGE-AT-0066]|nr:hypothetical protein BKA62DRAFT_776104 [Auriculariales sp. MPI-PUGE-AT-0066]